MSSEFECKVRQLGDGLEEDILERFGVVNDDTIRRYAELLHPATTGLTGLSFEECLNRLHEVLEESRKRGYLWPTEGFKKP